MRTWLKLQKQQAKRKRATMVTSTTVYLYLQDNCCLQSHYRRIHFLWDIPNNIPSSVITRCVNTTILKR